EKLPKLRRFVQFFDQVLYRYDELIVPFLHRMLNLEEELSLKNIIDHIAQLNKFIYNIHSIIDLDNQIITCVDYFSEAAGGRCDIYSYSYTLKKYNKITNNFSGGLFECFREISLFDEQFFGHEFF
ncbi:unnamed protein product, partial [Rotaria sp. Silwood1]